MRPPPPVFPGAMAGPHKMPPMPFMPFGPNPYLMAAAAGHFNPMMAPGLDAARMAASAFAMMPGMPGAMPGVMPGAMPGYLGMPPASMMAGAPAGGAAGASASGAAEAVPGIGPVTKGLRGRRGGVEPDHAQANGKENSANGHAGGAAASKDAKKASDGAEVQTRSSDVAVPGAHKDQDADVPAAAARAAAAAEDKGAQEPAEGSELQRQQSATQPSAQPRQQQAQQQPALASEQQRAAAQQWPVPQPGALASPPFRPALSAAQLAAATAQYKQSVDGMAGGGSGASSDIVDSRKINLYRQHLMFLERTLGNMHPQVSWGGSAVRTTLIFEPSP